MKTLAKCVVCGLAAVTLGTLIAQPSMAGPPPPPFPKKPIFIPMPMPIYQRPVIVENVYPARTYYVADVSNPAPLANIRLANPASNEVALRFRLNDGLVQTLPAGSSIEIRRESVISFDRGGLSGRARYSLTDGIYRFTPAGGIWDLVRETTLPVPASQVAEAANPVPVK